MKLLRRLKRIGSLALILSTTVWSLPSALAADDIDAAKSGDVVPGTQFAETVGIDDWGTISEIVGKIYGEWNGDSYSGAYSDQMPNTALLGNGDVGITSAGAKEQKTFLISKSDFVSAGNLLGVFNSGDNLTKPLPIGGITIQQKPIQDDNNPNLSPTNKSVTASSEYEDFYPVNAVNGNMQSSPRGYGWVTPVGRTHWLELEYDAPITVQRWVVKNDGAVRSGVSMNNTSAFRLQVSDTGGPDAMWTDVSVIGNNTMDVYDENLIAPVTSAHFRLYITNPLQESNTDPNPRARIGQFELYEHSQQTAPVQGNPTPTYEKQDILNSQIETKMSINGVMLSMKTWLSSSKNMLVTELTSLGSESVDLEVNTWGKMDNRNFPATADEVDGYAVATRTTYNNAPLNPNSWTSKSALATKVLGAESTVSVNSMKGTGTTAFTLDAGQTVQIVTATGGGGKNYDAMNNLLTTDPVIEASALLSSITSVQDVESLRADHQSWWKNFWSASYINIPDYADVQKYYYGAQYLLGSTAKSGKIAPGLYGVWHTTDTPAWSSDYHLNYNFIATFYGANSSNRSDLSLPAGEALLSFVPEGMRRAEDPNQLRRINAGYVNNRPDLQNGIADAVLYPVGIGPWGTVMDDSYHSEALNAAYSSYPLIQYYHYTQDETYLETYVYDYLKKVVNFYDAWLDKTGDTYTLYAGYNEGSWAINPAVELAALKNVLSELIAASVTLDRDADLRVHWQDIFDHLAPQPTSVWKGKQVYALAEKEWKNGQWVDLANPVPGDGNIIPLDIVVPGGQLGYYSPDSALQIARNTIDVFGTSAWRQINNFPRIFNDAVHSRYPADVVLGNMTNTIRAQIQPNLRISDGVHGVEKIGATEAINSMLLMSDQGVMKVFPNWVSGKSATFARLRAPGAFVVSAAYDGASNEVQSVTIKSEAGKPLTVASPWVEGADVFDSSGHEIETTTGTAPNWESEATVTFDTVAGETYILRKLIPEYLTTATLSPATPNGENGWYTTDVNVSLSVSVSVYGGSVTTEYQVNDGEWIVYNGSIPAFGDGNYTLGYRSKDQAGNIEQFKTVEFNVDKTAPTLSIQLDKTSIWPPNHKMVTINVLLNSSDTISDVESVLLTSITSNQPDSGNGDIEADFGTAATSFSLRAEKSRIYTITYTATDKAGNKTVESVTVTVPHDQSGNQSWSSEGR